MIAVSPIAVTSASLQVPPSAVAVTATALVSTRQTLTAVSAPLSNSQASNDAQSSDTAETSSGPSSAFLTQVIGQSESEQQDTQIAVATSFSRFAPAPQYAQFVGYGVVKFRPSDAGLPSGFSSAAPASQEEATQVAAPVDYQAYSTTQSRNSFNLASSEPQLSVAG